MVSVYKSMNEMLIRVEASRLRSVFLSFIANPDIKRCHQFIGSASQWLELLSTNEDTLIQSKALCEKYGDNEQALSLYLPMIDFDSRLSLTAQAFFELLWPLCPSDFHAKSGYILQMLDNVFADSFQDVESQSGNNRIKVIHGLKILLQILAHLARCGNEAYLIHAIYQNMSAVIQSAQAAVAQLEVSTNNDKHNRSRGQCLNTCLRLQCQAINWVIDRAKLHEYHLDGSRSEKHKSGHEKPVSADMKEFSGLLDSLNQSLLSMNRPAVNCPLADRLVRDGNELSLKNHAEQFRSYSDYMQKITLFEKTVSDQLSLPKQRAIRPVINAMIYRVTANTKRAVLLYDDQRGSDTSSLLYSHPSDALLALSWDELIQEGVRRLETHRWPRYEGVKQLLIQLGRLFTSLFGCCHQSVLLSEGSLFHPQKKPSSASFIPAFQALCAG